MARHIHIYIGKTKDSSSPVEKTFLSRVDVGREYTEGANSRRFRVLKSEKKLLQGKGGKYPIWECTIEYLEPENKMGLGRK